jgi:hypothetical protein
MNEDVTYDIRIDPKTNKPVRGRFIWTPLPGESFSDTEELVYTPIATEYLDKDLIIRDSHLKPVRRPIEPKENKIDIGRPSIKAAYDIFKCECICGCSS